MHMITINYYLATANRGGKMLDKRKMLTFIIKNYRFIRIN